jgi:hypothetical protein
MSLCSRPRSEINPNVLILSRSAYPHNLDAVDNERISNLNPTVRIIPKHVKDRFVYTVTLHTSTPIIKLGFIKWEEAAVFTIQILLLD